MPISLHRIITSIALQPAVEVCVDVSQPSLEPWETRLLYGKKVYGIPHYRAGKSLISKDRECVDLSRGLSWAVRI